MNSIFKNSLIYTLGEILPKISSFLLLPVFTRYLSTEEYGILSYTESFMLLFSVLGTLGLNSYALRYYFERKDEESRKLLIGTVYMVIGIANVILLVIGFITFPKLIEKYSIQVPWYPFFLLAIINNFLSSFNSIPLVVYRVRQDSTKYVALNFSRFFLQLLLNICFVVFLEKGILGYYISTLIVNVPYFFVYLAIIKNVACFRISYNYVKEGLKFSLPLLPGSISFFFLTVADRIILERYVSLSDMGIYNIAISLSGALGMVIQSGYHAIEPEMFNKYAQPDYFPFIKKTQAYYFSAIYVMAMTIALYSQEVFAIMTAPSFHKGYHLVPIILIGIVMSGQNIIYDGVLSAEKRTKIIGAISIIGACISLVFNVLVIPYLGTIAAALSRMVSYVIMNVILFAAMTYPGKSISKELFSTLILFIIPHIVFLLFPEISMLGLVVKLLIILFFSFLLIKMYNIDIKGLGFLIKY